MIFKNMTSIIHNVGNPIGKMTWLLQQRTFTRKKKEQEPIDSKRLRRHVSQTLQAHLGEI